MGRSKLACTPASLSHYPVDRKPRTLTWERRLLTRMNRKAVRYAFFQTAAMCKPDGLNHAALSEDRRYRRWCLRQDISVSFKQTRDVVQSLTRIAASMFMSRGCFPCVTPVGAFTRQAEQPSSRYMNQQSLRTTARRSRCACYPCRIFEAGHAEVKIIRDDQNVELALWDTAGKLQSLFRIVSEA